MKFLNFGSMNMDIVYNVDHFTSGGETQAAARLEVFHGGKGLNQSIALARAGAQIYHAGCIGADGIPLKETLYNNNVNADYVKIVPGASGHAIIQIDKNGQNAILLHGGSNHMVEKDFIDQVLSNFSKDDILILQNEISNLTYLIERGARKGMKIVLNPSPLTEELLTMNLSHVSVFIMNEIEAKALSNKNTPNEMLIELRRKYPEAVLVITLGESGVICDACGRVATHNIYPVPVVDTTAAGDTFTGYFVATYMAGAPLEEALRLASMASALAVSSKGAASSIPTIEQVKNANF